MMNSAFQVRVDFIEMQWDVEGDAKTGETGFWDEKFGAPEVGGTVRSKIDWRPYGYQKT